MFIERHFKVHTHKFTKMTMSVGIFSSENYKKRQLCGYSFFKVEQSKWVPQYEIGH